MSIEYKITKGKIMEGRVPEGKVKRKWVAVGRLARAEGPSMDSNRSRKGWIFNLDADGLGCSFVYKGMAAAKVAGFQRALALTTGPACKQPCEMMGDATVEGGEPTVLVQKLDVEMDPTQGGSEAASASPSTSPETDEDKGLGNKYTDENGDQRKPGWPGNVLTHKEHVRRGNIPGPCHVTRKQREDALLLRAAEWAEKNYPGDIHALEVAGRAFLEGYKAGE